MHSTLARRALGNLVPPKIATPSSVSGGSAASLAPLVQFYSKLPKGPAPQRAGSFGAKLLNAKNASGKPILVTIASLMLLGYTIDYQIPRQLWALVDPLNFGPPVMFQHTAVLLLSSSILLCSAYNTINVYFDSSHLNNHVPYSLSRFVGLEAFETYGELVPQAIIGKPYQFITPGNEKPDILMLGFENEKTMKRYSSIANHFYSTVTNQTMSVVDEELAPSRFLDTSVIASLQSEAAGEFFSTLRSVISFVEDKKDDKNDVRFGSFKFRSLENMQNSVDPESYQMALNSLKALISSALRSFSVAVLIPNSPNTVTRRETQPPPQSPLPIPKSPGTAPVYSTSTCYPSQEACKNSTSSCSSRGTCVAATRAQRTCFVCQCHPAPLTEGGKNIEWAGAMCQKVDISRSFSLLAGTVIFLIIIVGGAIMLLYSIGSQPLPGTLNVSTGTIAMKKDL
ncbi:hypothetical protein Clacol_009552 [Clathrus columnatus]|uniref:Vacuolar sorting protein Vps3844 C-terminal domain-containing protein n=1 Tax=Clathrus columnatus TaxID=1419009 RepID=A0AAV5ASF4_9AGAM|nr:hypothetical protein Clacol_009552 [Clathrus columnatus]